MNDIFLSYNREDAAVAKRFADGFAAEGLSVWWDIALRSGEAYDEVTEAALRGAKAVVVLWSPRSVVSRWVRAEATLADRAKTLVPVMIEACERPIMFELTQTAELSHWSGDAADGAWLAFLSDVRGFVGRKTAAPASTAPAPPPEPTPVKPGERGGAPSLAVLPFTNRSGLSEDDVFAVGMVEDVVAALSQGVNVRVLSSSATARFAKDLITDVAALGEQLGVRYLLEGNVRRVGVELRVTAQLVETERGEILWTQKFDRKLVELSVLQEELVSEVAANLGTQVFRIEIERALKKPGNLTAWECVTRAEGGRRDISLESFLQSQSEAERAVAIAPDYGLAHAILGQAISLISWLRADNDPATVSKVAHHVERALALDPNSAAVLNYASQALNYTQNFDEGLRLGRRALSLRPLHGPAHFSCGCSCMMLGRADDALQHFRDFLRIDPHSHLEFAGHYNIGRTYLGIGDWQAADAALTHSLTLNTLSPAAYCQLAIAKSKLGHAGSASAAMAKARALEPAAPLDDWVRRLTLWYPHSTQIDQIITELRHLWAGSEPNA